MSTAKRFLEVSLRWAWFPNDTRCLANIDSVTKERRAKTWYCKPGIIGKSGIWLGDIVEHEDMLIINVDCYQIIIEYACGYTLSQFFFWLTKRQRQQKKHLICLTTYIAGFIVSQWPFKDSARRTHKQKLFSLTQARDTTMTSPFQRKKAPIFGAEISMEGAICRSQVAGQNFSKILKENAIKCVKRLGCRKPLLNSSIKITLLLA